MNRFLFTILVCLSLQHNLYAQEETSWIKGQIVQLAGSGTYGRGYVFGGKEKAAKYITRKFKEFGLKAVTPDSFYTQDYYFPVNTFPGTVALSVDGEDLIPGKDFLVDAASASFNKRNIKIKTLDFDEVHFSVDWTTAKSKLRTDKFCYFFKNIDSFFKRTDDHEWNFSRGLDKGCYIIPKHGKMFWTVATEQMPATVLYVEDTVLPKLLETTAVTVDAEFLQQQQNKNKNIIACVPGTVKDSFIVFTAHYDHLGMMGEDATFSGASDNASGTAMMLYLAYYFAQHPQRYTMVFIAFSGEEAGILGSGYFVKHPLIPLSNIRFLTNIDIMGDATDGITVVNATEYKKQFDLLQQINKNNNYLPQIKSRGKTRNSDHYHFTEAGVPAFFIYSNGGVGYYHDVFDKPSSLHLTNIDKAAKLFVEFATALNNTHF